MSFIPASAWFELKAFAERASGVPMDTMHVIAGVLLQLLFARLLRVSLVRWTPWLLVLALEIANEAYDLWVERWPQIGMQLGEGAKDLLLTMALPTLLMVAARLRPSLFTAD